MGNGLAVTPTSVEFHACDDRVVRFRRARRRHARRRRPPDLFLFDTALGRLELDWTDWIARHHVGVLDMLAADRVMIHRHLEVIGTAFGSSTMAVAHGMPPERVHVIGVMWAPPMSRTWSDPTLRSTWWTRKRPPGSTS